MTLVSANSRNGKLDTVTTLVVLSVPHEMCKFINSGHYCDPSARILADTLFISLQNLGGTAVVLVPGDINRQDIDLNRMGARFTPFRQEIKNIVNSFISTPPPKGMKKIIYLVDCHSFPTGQGHYSTKTVPNPDVAILFDDASTEGLVTTLQKILYSHGIVANRISGCHNDIIDEFNQRDTNSIIIPVLIELNEELDPKKLPLVGISVKEWIQTINSYFSIKSL